MLVAGMMGFLKKKKTPHYRLFTQVRIGLVLATMIGVQSFLAVECTQMEWAAKEVFHTTMVYNLEPNEHSLIVE